MDSNPDERPSKIQRRIDRISELPNPILRKILCLLPTKYAFATSILSTRWKNIWNPPSPITIDLDDSVIFRPDGNARDRESAFVTFVDKLFHRYLCYVRHLDTMTLKCGTHYGDDEQYGGDDDKFLYWVSAAVLRNVRELRLKCCLFDVLPLFESLKECSKLTLELTGNLNFCYDGDREIKPNKLKILRLCYVVFGGDDLAHSMEGRMMGTLNKCCPQLEELSLIDCDLQSLGLDNVLFEFPGLETLIIRNSLTPSCKVKIRTRNLKSLELVNVTFDAEIKVDVGIDESGVEDRCETLMSLFFGFPVLEELSLTNCDWQGVPDLVIECHLLRSLIMHNSLGSSNRLTINTPNLQQLLLKDRITNYNFVHPFNSLRSADIDVGPSEKQLAASNKLKGDKEPWYKHARGLLRYCCDTRHLHLSTRSIEILRHTPVDLPTFHNLASLKLGCLCRSGWEVLARLLCSAPYLEKLVFEKGFEEGKGGYAEFESVVSTPPICLKLNLKEINFLEFNDMKDGFKLIEYFLKNGEVMQRLKLQCRDIKNRNSYKTLHMLSEKSKIVITYASWKDEEISSHMV